MEAKSTRYVVVCEECGEVEFEELDHDWFGSQEAATWYAGYHSGKEHPESDRQMAVPEEG